MNHDSKITPPHLQRNAYIYIRQSTDHQVRENIESQQRQYELVSRLINSVQHSGKLIFAIANTFMQPWPEVL